MLVWTRGWRCAEAAYAPSSQPRLVVQSLQPRFFNFKTLSGQVPKPEDPVPHFYR